MKKRNCLKGRKLRYTRINNPIYVRIKESGIQGLASRISGDGKTLQVLTESPAQIIYVDSSKVDLISKEQ